MIIVLDPASSRTGYAVMDELLRTIVEAGYLRGKDSDPALQRILAIEVELSRLVSERQPRAIVMEITKGKVNKKRHGGGGAGLATYGLAVGAIWRTARDLVGVQNVVPVDESWTGGVKKEIRARRIAVEFPQYAKAMAADNGGDVADAIGIGLWWINEQRTKGLLAAVA